ncbi:FlxA-like family protein [Mycolicibacterium sp. 050232]|uniref:FlxA-like family protein n=1 Tax=Mycolicibacterium sp. 050232 TaxID=3113982 RepID=UPI002E28ED85|nr:FlxA-like family protein [Mycolicibacterium sp. 050232]MED5812923.1 FlxA-like family protein [Mycolicibacterium sp. 050232]
MTDEQVAKQERWFTFGLIVVAAGLVVTALAVECPDRHCWATTLQLVGGIIAAVGFANAYVGALYGTSLAGQIVEWGEDVAKELWRRLLGKPKLDVRQPQAAPMTFTGGTPGVRVTYNFAFDPDVPADEQFRRIAEHLNAIGPKIEALDKQIAALSVRINEVATNSQEAADNAIKHIQEQIAGLSAELKRKQVLDLRWAIVGLLITVVGIALGY